ncbi:MAG: superoxide dismutase [Acidobacteriota bacterium]
MKRAELSPLPYPADALEPWYDRATVELHHGKHHAAYVAGFNAALEKLEKARAAGDHVLIKHLCREVAFHGGGHILHDTFWTNLSPKGGGTPEGPFARRVAGAFGSFASFDAQFRAAAVGVEGSGWAVLAASTGGDLAVLQVEKHQNQVLPGWTPILVLDVWEHAYYLKYQNRRADWVAAVMDHLVNWADVVGRFEAARRT